MAGGSGGHSLRYKASVDATEARGEIERLAASLEGLGDSEDGIEKVAAALDKAIKRMEQAGDSPMKLGRSAGMAQFQLDELREALEKAGVKGTKVPADIAAAMDKAAASIARAAERSAKMRDTLDEVGKTGKMAGDRIDTLRGSVGSLDGIFDRMRETGTGATKAIGNIGASLGLMSVAVGGAVMAGKQLGDWIDTLSESYGKVQKRQEDASVKTVLYEQALRLASTGIIKFSSDHDELIRRSIEYQVVSGKSTAQTKDFVAAVAGLKVPPTLAELDKRVNDISKAFAGMWAESKDKAAAALVANANVIDALLKGYAALGKQAPEELKTLKKALDEVAVAQRLMGDEGFAKKVVAGYAAIQKAAKDATDAAIKGIQDERKSLEEKRKAMDADLAAERISNEEYSARKKALYEEELAAIKKSADAQLEAEKKAKAAQDDMQTELGVSKTAWTGIVEVSKSYAAALERGESPSKAAVAAQKSLAEYLEKTKAAIPDVASGMEKLTDKMMASVESGGKLSKALADIGLAEQKVKTEGAAAIEASAAMAVAAFEKMGSSAVGTVSQLDALAAALRRVKAAQDAVAGQKDPGVGMPGDGG